MKIAVLGLGSAGARHSRHLLELGHEVIGWDPVASPPDGVRPVASLDAAIAESEAVVVASPSSLHAEQAIAALAQQRPVLVEKPLAVDVLAAESVVEAARAAGVVCAVAMNLRFHPGVVELKRLVDSGELGSIRYAQASFGYDLRLWHPGADYRKSYSARADLGGGIVLDAIHELDYLLWLLGPVATVSAETSHVSELEIDVEDVAVAVLRFESGALASVDLNFFEPAYRRGCLLVGSRAVARWDWERKNVVVSREGEHDGLILVAGDLADTYRAEVVDFIAAIEGEAAPRTRVEGGLNAVRLAETIKSAALLGQRLAVETE